MQLTMQTLSPRAYNITSNATLDGGHPGQLRSEPDELAVLHPGVRLQRGLARLLVRLPDQLQLLRARNGQSKDVLSYFY